jgi:hypothetical protein
MKTAIIAKNVSAQALAADRRILEMAELVTRLQDPIAASHTDSPGEAKQNPMNYLARNTQFSGVKLCPILGLSGRYRDVIAATSLDEKESRLT